MAFFQPSGHTGTSSALTRFSLPRFMLHGVDLGDLHAEDFLNGVLDLDSCLRSLATSKTYFLSAVLDMARSVIIGRMMMSYTFVIMRTPPRWLRALPDRQPDTWH
jgi:hypothetical protein